MKFCNEGQDRFFNPSQIVKIWINKELIKKDFYYCVKKMYSNNEIFTASSYFKQYNDALKAFKIIIEKIEESINE